MKMSKLTAITLATLAALALTTTATAQKTTCKWVQDPDKHFGGTMLLCEPPRPLTTPQPRGYNPYEYLSHPTQLADDPFTRPQPGDYDPRAALDAQIAQALRAQTELHVACIRARGTFKNGVCTWESRSTQK